MSTQPQENAIGLAILYQVLDNNGNPRNITGFTTHDLIFRRPDGTLITKAAVFQTDGTDGIFEVISVDGDLRPFGSYEVQAHLKNLSFDEYTEVAVFHVNRNVTP